MTGNGKSYFRLPCDCAKKMIVNLKSHGYFIPGFGMWTDGEQDAAILQAFSRLTDKDGKPLKQLLIELPYCPFCGLSAKRDILVSKERGNDENGIEASDN